MGLPYTGFIAWIPELLTTAWKVPVMRAGYQIAPIPQARFDELAALGISPKASYSLCRVVSYGSSAVEVWIEKVQWCEHGEPDVWIVEFMKGGNQQLEENLIRISIASGARPYLGETGYQRIYRCPKGTVKYLLDHLEQCDSTLQLAFLRRQGEELQQDQAEAFPQGEIHRDTRAIRFFAGPAIDPDTGMDIDFIALDYKQLLLFGRRQVNRLVSDIETELLGQGACRLEILEPPKPSRKR